MRTSSPRAPDGTAYGISVEPDVLFRVAPDGTTTEMGPVEGYTASLAISPDGGTLYYVPGAHGDAYESGAPLIAVDTATGEHRTVVEMQDMFASALGLRFGGTYDVVIDPGGKRLYIGANAGPANPAGEDERHVRHHRAARRRPAVSERTKSTVRYSARRADRSLRASRRCAMSGRRGWVVAATLALTAAAAVRWRR